MKKQTATFSQVSYIVTGILSAHTQRGDELTDEVIEKAVRAAKTASEAISEIVSDGDTDSQPISDPFKDYPWSDKPERYTDLANYLKQQGVTSNRRISEIFRECIERGYLLKDPLTAKYTHGSAR
jgi:predicted Zn-dependent protease